MNANQIRRGRGVVRLNGAGGDAASNSTPCRKVGLIAKAASSTRAIWPHAGGATFAELGVRSCCCEHFAWPCWWQCGALESTGCVRQYAKHCAFRTTNATVSKNRTLLQ